jgi:hypothetical protein
VMYLQCYQFLLMGQIKALNSLGLPIELEVTNTIAAMGVDDRAL